MISRKRFDQRRGFITYPVVDLGERGEVKKRRFLDLMPVRHQNDGLTHVDRRFLDLCVNAGGGGELASGRDASCADEAFFHVVGFQALERFKADERVDLSVELSGQGEERIVRGHGDRLQDLKTAADYREALGKRVAGLEKLNRRAAGVDIDNVVLFEQSRRFPADLLLGGDIFHPPLVKADLEVRRGVLNAAVAPLDNAALCQLTDVCARGIGVNVEGFADLLNRGKPPFHNELLHLF